MAESAPAPRTPWTWVPTLYLAQGLPYVVVMSVSVVMYKRLGVSNTDIALYTSWLYLPWVIKPLWSPLVELFGTRRGWVTGMQWALAIALGAVALSLPGPGWFTVSLGVLWLMAFASATHDIAADGFYLLGLGERQQAAFVGVRSTFYRIAMLAGQGLLVMLAGHLETRTGRPAMAWALTFGALAGGYAVLAGWHTAALPRPAADRPGSGATGSVLADFGRVFAAFLRKPGIVTAVAFLLLYRLAEAQLVKLVAPFLLDAREAGGLALDTGQVGFAYGTVGIAALTAGGLLGGWLISRYGLRALFWPMAAAIHLPDLIFVYLASSQPESLAVITTGVALEQFGYGLGFAAYLLYMIWLSDGEHRTAHYAICTGFMALGMMLPGMVSGAIQEALGYRWFFWWVVASTIPAFVMVAVVRRSVPAGFGRGE